MLHTGRQARWAAAAVPVTFDLLHLTARTGRDGPSSSASGSSTASSCPVGPEWATNGWYPGEGETLLAVCADLGHEGMVAKRLDSPYLAGRRVRTWLKWKCPEWVRVHAPRRRPAVPASR